MKREPPGNRLFRAERLTIGQCNSGDSEKAPIEMLARTPAVVWRWGTGYVHDLATMRSKSRIPVDFHHDDEAVIGYLDAFEVTESGLVGRGYLVPFAHDDRASEAIHKAHAGIPYEASIYWDSGEANMEKIGAGKEVELNGRTYTGPLVVVRNWDLLAVALVLHGADRETAVKLSEEDGMAVDDKTILDRLSSGFAALLRRGPAVDVPVAQADDPEDIDLNAVEGQANEKQSSTDKGTVEGAADENAEGDKLADEPAEVNSAAILYGMFGEKGAVWAAEGKSLEECCGLYVGGLVDEIRQLKEEKAALERRLESTDSDGETEPVYHNLPGADIEVSDADRLGIGEARARKAALVAGHRKQKQEQE